MSDRPISLYTGTGGLTDKQPSQSEAEDRKPADDQDIERFRHTLLQAEPAAEKAGVFVATTAHGAGVPAGESGHARGVFGLFGHLRAGNSTHGSGISGPDAQSLAGLGTSGAPVPAGSQAGLAEAAPEEPRSAGLGRLTDEMAERILVSADGAREVRIVVRDDVLAGVELRMRQQEGRWVVGFVVTDASSLKVLEGASSMLARELAKRLQCGVEVRLTDGSAGGSEDEPSFTSFADAPRTVGEPG